MRFFSEAQDWARKVAQKIREVAKAGLEKVRAERRHEAPPDEAAGEPPEAPPEAPAVAPPEAPVEVAGVAEGEPAEGVPREAQTE